MCRLRERRGVLPVAGAVAAGPPVYETALWSTGGAASGAGQGVERAAGLVKDC